MVELLHRVEPVFWWVARASWQAAVLAGLVLLAQWAFRRRLTAGWRSALWLLVLGRLVLPAAPSRLSLFNLFPREQSPPAASMGPAESPAGAAALARADPPAGGPGPVDPPRPRPALTGPDAGPTAPVGAIEPQIAMARGQPPPEAPWWTRLGPALAGIWLAGAAAMLLRLALAVLAAGLRLRRLAPSRDPQLLALLDQCRATMGVRRRLRVCLTSAVRTPALAGVLRARLLLPAGILDSIPPGELRFMLLHELGHLKRLDLPVHWLAALLRAVHWFNPVLWWAFARLRADRELACDALVLSRTAPREALDYGQAIVNLLERLSARAVLPGAVGVLEDGRQIQRRIAMIATFRRPARGWTILGAALAAMLGVPLLTDARPGDPPATQPAGAIEAPAHPWVKPLAPLSPAAAEADRKIEQLLGKRLAEVKFDNTELTAVIDWFREVTGINVEVRWSALEVAGVTSKHPVTLHLADVTAQRALRAILDSVGGTTPSSLDFDVDDGVLAISTREDMSGLAHRVTKVYDVRALLLGASPAEHEAVDWSSLSGELVKTIQDQVDPTSWRGEAGGDIGRISANYGQLVITQTTANQRQIENLLARLMEARLPKWKQDIQDKLQKTLPRVELNNVEFSKALDWLHQATGLNIVVAPGAAGARAVGAPEPGPVGPVPGGPGGFGPGGYPTPAGVSAAPVPAPAGGPLITLKVEDLTAQQVLSLIVRMAGMRWDLLDGAVYVYAPAGWTAAPAVAPPAFMPGMAPLGGVPSPGYGVPGAEGFGPPGGAVPGPAPAGPGGYAPSPYGPTAPPPGP